jgi:hypothetical protein
LFYRNEEGGSVYVATTTRSLTTSGILKEKLRKAVSETNQDNFVTKAPKWHQIISQTAKNNRKFTRAHRSSRNKLLSELQKQKPSCS